MINKRIVKTVAIFIAIVVLTPVDNTSSEEIVKVENVEQTQQIAKVEDTIEDNISDINIILNDWKTYRDKQYIPDLDRIEAYMNIKYDEEGFKLLISKNTKDVNLNPAFYNILFSLNPYGTTNRLYKSNIDLAFGITQINVKLLPLATLQYPDFESNTKSQLMFLNDYINIKSEKGFKTDEIIRQYKYCDYN